MTDKAEIAQGYDLLGGKPMSTIEGTLNIPPPAADAPARVDETGAELKRGAILNTTATLASNLRGVFTFLVARLLGPAALGTFSVAWANTDLASKIAVFGLDNAITTFIARSQATGNLARSRALFRAAVVLVLTQSTLVAAIGITAVQMFGDRLQFPRETLSALAFVLCALPGIALYRVCTSISRGMKVMKHDIYSRGMTEPVHHDAGAFDRARLWIHKVRAGGGRRFRNRGFGNCRTHICLKTLQRCDSARHRLHLDRSKTIARLRRSYQRLSDV
jgi:hypothetical protein